MRWLCFISGVLPSFIWVDLFSARCPMLLSWVVLCCPNFLTAANSVDLFHPWYLLLLIGVFLCHPRCPNSTFWGGSLSFQVHHWAHCGGSDSSQVSHCSQVWLCIFSGVSLSLTYMACIISVVPLWLTWMVSHFFICFSAANWGFSTSTHWSGFTLSQVSENHHCCSVWWFSIISGVPFSLISVALHHFMYTTVIHWCSFASSHVSHCHLLGWLTFVLVS